MEVLLDSLRARLGPDTRISASSGGSQAPSDKPIGKSPDRSWSKKTPSPSPSTTSISNPAAKSTEPATSEPASVDYSKMKCFSCQQLGHRATQCPQKPMSQEEQNTVAKALALERQRKAHLRDVKAKSLNMLREVFDEDSYREADAHLQAILRNYRTQQKT